MRPLQPGRELDDFSLDDRFEMGRKGSAQEAWEEWRDTRGADAQP
jgi:hypothetical protein